MGWWVVSGAILGELVCLVVFVYAFGQALVGHPVPWADVVGILGSLGFGPLIGGLAALWLVRGRAVARWVPVSLVAGVAVLVGLALWFERDTRSEFERNLVAALDGDVSGIGECVRAGPGLLYCVAYEGSSSREDALRVVCRGTTCVADWPIEAEYSVGDEVVQPGVSFTCDGDCHEPIARGYVYELVYASRRPGGRRELHNLGRVETDTPLEEDLPASDERWWPQLTFEGIYTPSGRVATVDATRLSSDATVDRVVLVTFDEESGRAPSWKPTYPPLEP